MVDSEHSQDLLTRSNATEDRRNGHETLHPDLTTRQIQRGLHQGDRYVRVIRSQMLRRVAPGVLRASEAVSRPSGKIGRWYTQLKAFLVGKPLPTAAEKEERLNKVRALAVLSSDAISSSAYATEEILLVVILAGTAAAVYSVPIAMGIAALLAIVAFSYRQTVHAYPQGGGAYNVSRENLGTPFGLIAAAALLVGYVLTVAVSIAAGTAAITSAAQEWYPYRVEISVALIVLITLINLRGIKESSTIFALPTYLFIFGLTTVIVLGLVRIALGDPRVLPRVAEGTLGPVEPLSLFLLLRAFAAGTVAMTGTEAIANGVPVFKPPESKNAAITLTWMSAILAFFFVGLTFVAYHYGITPHETETVISQVARVVLRNEWAYAFFQATTMLILILAANTSYFGFPRLAYVLAQDGFMPHQLTFRGDRLVFTNGIVMLGAMSILLVVLFEGSTHALIPLYAIGVFISFTLSQSGMVRHWWKLRAPGWRKSMAINAIGATLTAMVVVVVGVAKFALGAWIVLVLIPILVFIFNAIQRHYTRVSEQLALPTRDGELALPRQIVIVPISELNKASLRALAFARSLASNAIALHIVYEPDEVETFRQAWARWGNGTQLVFLESPYRAFVEPLLAYIEELHRQDPDACVTIVLPEFIPAHWWEHFLHNQTALRLKTSLLFRKNTVVIDVPYHLDE